MLVLLRAGAHQKQQLLPVLILCECDQLIFFLLVDDRCLIRAHVSVDFADVSLAELNRRLCVLLFEVFLVFQVFFVVLDQEEELKALSLTQSCIDHFVDEFDFTAWFVVHLHPVVQTPTMQNKYLKLTNGVLRWMDDLQISRIAHVTYFILEDGLADLDVARMTVISVVQQISLCDVSFKLFDQVEVDVRAQIYTIQHVLLLAVSQGVTVIVRSDGDVVDGQVSALLIGVQRDAMNQIVLIRIIDHDVPILVREGEQWPLNVECSIFSVVLSLLRHRPHQPISMKELVFVKFCWLI